MAKSTSGLDPINVLRPCEILPTSQSLLLHRAFLRPYIRVFPRIVCATFTGDTFEVIKRRQPTLIGLQKITQLVRMECRFHHLIDSF